MHVTFTRVQFGLHFHLSELTYYRVSLHFRDKELKNKPVKIEVQDQTLKKFKTRQQV